MERSNCFRHARTSGAVGGWSASASSSCGSGLTCSPARSPSLGVTRIPPVRPEPVASIERAVEHPAGYEPGAPMYIGLGTILLIVIIVLVLRR